MRTTSSSISVFSTLALFAQGTFTCADLLNTLTPTIKTLDPAPSLHRRASCSNALLNASFEAITIIPWTIYATGSWASRDVVQGGAQSGNHFFAAQSNSTSTSTITISQPISLSSSTSVQCEAWIKADGGASFEVFLGGVSCGTRALIGTGRWVRVGGKVEVGAGTQQVVIVGVVDGEVEIGIDGVWVGKGC